MSESLLNELSDKLQNKEVSPVELLQSYLDKIEKGNPKIGAFVEVEKDSAIAAAKESEQRIQSGDSLSKYDGIPVGIKDNIVKKGLPTTAGSKILKGFVSPYSSTVINKLESSGLIPLGRLNMDEFAMGSSTENSAYLQTKNPYDLERAPGGSSGGSAAAVSADLLPVTLGSDTGGSIRQPAAFTGVVGLKPTYGTVSRYGLVAFASSLDQIGPLTRYTQDNEIVYNIIKGHDSHDSTSIPNDQYVESSYDLKNLRIGVPNSLIQNVDEEVKDSFQQTLDFITSEIAPQAKVVDVNLEHQKYGIAVYYLTATSEASANLSRFDGVRYGNRADAINNLNDLYEKTRSEGFGPEVKRRILLGTYALSSGYYDAYYGQAQKTRRLIRDDYVKAFEDVDVILMPTTPSVPFKLGERTKDPVQMYLSDELTVGASLAGISALSVPGPFKKLPIGIQLQGNYFAEKLLFDISKKIQEKFPTTPPAF